MQIQGMGRTLSTLLLTLAIGACGSETASTDAAATIEAAPANEAVPVAAGPAGQTAQVVFELSDMEGVMRSSSEWDGKPKLLNFWATWCAPCRREIPLLKDTQDAQGGSLQVIGIAVDFMDDVVAYAEDAQFNYPILVGETDAMEVAESSGVPFIGLPFTMIVSASGELIDTHVGEIEAQHIDQITAVLDEMGRGTLDLAGARERLKNL